MQETYEKVEPHLVVAWMVEGDMDVFPLSANSVSPWFNSAVVIDGNQEPCNEWATHLQQFVLRGELRVQHRPFPHSDKGADGIQRQRYLEYLQAHFMGSWVLVLDADEFLEGGHKLRGLIRELEAQEVVAAHVKMRHFVGDFGHEDATQELHLAPFRLFKVTPDLHYPPMEHSVLRLREGCKFKSVDEITLWHINTARGQLRTKNKYLLNLNKSTIHSEDFLNQWYHSHALGLYPTKQVSWQELPPVLTDFLAMNRDYLYFAGRRIPETKHFYDAYHWRREFKPGSVIEWGCGIGVRLQALKIVGINKLKGVEISEYAVKNSLMPDAVVLGDITTPELDVGEYDLAVVYDVLEHVDEDKLMLALDNVYRSTKEYAVISVPFIGDPNLMNDPTHKIFRSRDWWEKKIMMAGFEIFETPQYFNFRDQLIIARKVVS